MPVRTRRMKNLERVLGYLKEVLVQKRTLKCPHQPKAWLKTSDPIWMEALNENAQNEPPMVQRDDMT